MELKPEVKAFLDHTNEFGCVCDGDNWFVNEKWAHLFRQHLEVMLKMAIHSHSIKSRLYTFVVTYTQVKRSLETIIKRTLKNQVIDFRKRQEVT